WEDVAGISVPTESQYSADRLVKWAALLAGDKELTSISSESGRKKVKVSLCNWLEGWRQQNVLERLDSISDNAMTTALWHLGSRARKSFGASADAVSSVATGTLDVEAALRMIQEAFSASEDEFKTLSQELIELRSMLDAIPVRNSIKRRVASFEMTHDPAVESVRAQINEALSSDTTAFDVQALNALWIDFKSKYDVHLAERHTAASRSHETRDKASEIMASQEWWVFENLANTGKFSQRYRQISRQIMRDLRVCNCTARVVTAERTPMFCPSCGFSPRGSRTRNQLPRRLWTLVSDGLASFESAITRQKDRLLAAIQDLSKSEKSEQGRQAATSLSSKLADGFRLLDLSEDELRVLQTAIHQHGSIEAADNYVQQVYASVISAETIIEDAVVLNS
ncbi:MAG TPA: DUF6079 family protein, partial [Pyrinomonadaceae bacterium]|nr:DUF6079 family protein [Pyrinomonadaceae bacterium]